MVCNRRAPVATLVGGSDGGPCGAHDLHTVRPAVSWYSPGAQRSQLPLVTLWKVPGAHGSHAYSLFERVSSTPQLPTRTEPAAHVSRSHVAFGHASLSWPWPV